MSLDSQGYVFSLQNNIRSRPIPWEGAVRAKTITDDANKKIKAIDKVRKELRKEVLDSDPTSYVSLYLGGKNEQSVFASLAKRQDILLYLLVLFEDSIQGNKYSSLLYSTSLMLLIDSDALMAAILKHPDPYSPFVPLLKQMNNPDDSLPLLAALILTKLLSQAVTSTKSNAKQEAAINSLYSYLSQLCKSSDPGHQDIAVQSYSSILRTKNTRVMFWEKRKETVDPLIDILRAGAGAGKDTHSSLWSDGASSTRTQFETGISGGVGIQLIYRVLLVIWQLSFEGELVGEGLQEYVLYDISHKSSH
jgi:V-type H+-transporting ATPase subunit H